MPTVFNLRSITLNYDGGLSSSMQLHKYNVSTTGPIGFQSATVRYKQVAQGAEVGFEQPGYDDSSWSTGVLPAGSGGNCSYQSTAPATIPWDVNTDMLIRMDIGGPFVNPEFELLIDNRVWGYLNGTQIFYQEGGFCDSFRTGVLDDISHGLHLMAFRCNDFGAEAYFDFRLFDGAA